MKLSVTLDLLVEVEAAVRGVEQCSSGYVRHLLPLSDVSKGNHSNVSTRTIATNGQLIISGIR